MALQLVSKDSRRYVRLVQRFCESVEAEGVDTEKNTETILARATHTEEDKYQKEA